MQKEFCQTIIAYQMGSVHVNTYKNKIELSHPMRLTDESAASHGNDNSSISIDRIQEILRGVKEEQYHQKNKDYTGQKDLIAYHNIS